MANDDGEVEKLKVEIAKLKDDTRRNRLVRLLLSMMLQAVLNKNDNQFMNSLDDLGNENRINDLSLEERQIIERIIQRYQDYVYLCITKNNYDPLTTILQYCNLSKTFFADVFTRICFIGHVECVSVAIDRISNAVSRDREIDKSSMEKLFDDNFYRRIVSHDRIALIQTLLAYENISWDKDLILRLAENGRYWKIIAYFKDPLQSERIPHIDETKIPDKRDKIMELNRRDELAEKIKEAVKKGDVFNLEQLLQDLSVFKKDYNNIDNILNESILSEDGTWNNERLIHWACRRGDLYICKILHKAGADLRVLSVFQTPAHVAIEADRLDVLQWLHGCDDYLIRDFFDFGWESYIDRIKQKKIDLPVLNYLLTSGCDDRYGAVRGRLLTDKNLSLILDGAISASSENYGCIDILLSFPNVSKLITPKHLKDAARKDDRLLSKLLAAAPMEKCIDDILNEYRTIKDKKGDDKKRKFHKTWRKKCKEALPEVFSKYVDSCNSKDEKGNIIGPITVDENGKLIFKEIYKANDDTLLNHPNVSKYIDDNLKTISPYYLDLIFVTFHLFCVSWFCWNFRSRNASLENYKPSESNWFLKLWQIINAEHWMWWPFLIFTAILTVKQFIEAYIKKWKFLNWQDFVETISYILSIFVLFRPFLPFLKPLDLVLIIVCLFFSWTNLFMKLMVIPMTIGLYMEMFSSILKIFRGVFVMVLMFLIWFSTAFKTLFYNEEPFRGYHSIVGKTLAMMTGEFDFGSLFFPEKSSPDTTDEKAATTLYSMDTSSPFSPQTASNSPVSTVDFEDHFSTYACSIRAKNGNFLTIVECLVPYYVFFFFCICLHILLLNLLVGLAVDDISKIMKDSEGRRLRKQAGLIADLDVLWSKAKFSQNCVKSENDTERETCTVDPEQKYEQELMSPKEKEPLLQKELSLQTKPPQGSDTILVIEETTSPARSSCCLCCNAFLAFLKKCWHSFLIFLGLEKAEKTEDDTTKNIEETVEKMAKELEDFKTKWKNEHRDVAKILDLMKEAIFQMDKRGRDLEDVLKEMDKRDRNLESVIKEMDNRQRDLEEVIKNTDIRQIINAKNDESSSRCQIN